MTLVALLVPSSHYRVGDTELYVGSFAVSGETVVRLGYLACNGALVLQSKYPKLFAEIGHAYNPSSPGTDPGGGQFYLPDYTDGRVFIPRGASNFPTRGTRGGAKTVALDPSGSQDAPHTHNVNNQRGAASSGATGAQRQSQTPYSGPDLHGGTYWGPGNNGATGGHFTPTSGSVQGRGGGSPAAHQNMPPVRVCGGRIIRYV